MIILTYLMSFRSTRHSFHVTFQVSGQKKSGYSSVAKKSSKDTWAEGHPDGFYVIHEMSKKNYHT